MKECASCPTLQDLLMGADPAEPRTFIEEKKLLKVGAVNDPGEVQSKLRNGYKSRQSQAAAPALWQHEALDWIRFVLRTWPLVSREYC